jgi:DNA invertase Pin-like site-specific DNA recombinase
MAIADELPRRSRRWPSTRRDAAPSTTWVGNRWASNSNVRLAGEHVDLGVSGAAELADRPGLMAALAALEIRGAALLVVAKRDRLARDVVVSAAVERLAESKGARIISADGTGNADGPEGMLCAA